MAGRSFEGLTASAQDLERRVAARTRERAESEARLTAIADNSPVAIAYLDTDLVVRFANPALEAWLALPPDRILGRPISEVIGPAAFAQRKDQLREALAGYRVRFEGAPPNASIGLRHSDSRYIPDIDEEGRVRGIYVFLIDVTELKEAQLALADAQETLRDHADALEVLVAERTSTLREAVEELEGFSYSIAHDMRAPLRAMQGYAQLLGQQNALDDRGREFVARIQASAERMDQLIRDVLDYSRVVRQELPVMTVAPEPLVREIIASYPQLHAPGVTVDVVGPMPSVRANPAALTQVFSNLLGNAVKFVAPGVKPSVVVRSEERSDATGRWIRFWVEDNGIGMAPEDTARIFEMFHRLRSAGAYAGTGMGLAIVRKAIERMDGRVGVESEPGRGSRFWFELRAPR
jgi:PAS domain S-box-containing protein